MRTAPPLGPQQAHKAANRRGLAGPVRPEVSEDLAPLDREGHILNPSRRAIPLRQTLNLNRGHCQPASSQTFPPCGSSSRATPPRGIMVPIPPKGKTMAHEGTGHARFSPCDEVTARLRRDSGRRAPPVCECVSCRSPVMTWVGDSHVKRRHRGSSPCLTDLAILAPCLSVLQDLGLGLSNQTIFGKMGIDMTLLKC
jgi:hypothetical protein